LFSERGYPATPMQDIADGLGMKAGSASRPGGAAEDDGYLMSFVYEAAEDRSELGIFDAADLRAGPVGRVKVPVRVPSGFHSCWVQAEDLDRARETID
jgi:carotenoid cleavage dioxygenase